MIWGGNTMLIDCIVGLVCAGLLLFMCWSLKGLMLRPVRKGENSALKIRLTTFGAEPQLESILDGLVWLRENGTLTAEIEIIANSPNEEVRIIGKTYAERRRYITFCEPGDC